jgi:Xaa-Pro aminopeptidase
MRNEEKRAGDQRRDGPPSFLVPHSSFLPGEAELAEKQRRVCTFLDQHALEGVLLGTIGNFAWITGGRTNRVGAATEVGPAAILVTRDGQSLVSDEVEAPRLLEEELAGQPLDLLDYPWYRADPAAAVRRRAAGRVASDIPVPGLETLPAAFTGLRWSLTEAELQRYRRLGQHAGVAMTHVLLHLRPGLSEQQIAGMLAEALFGFGIQPTVLLVAADERMARFRHPLPTERRLQRAAMLVVGARGWGLVVSLTRLVHFGDPDADLRKRHAAVTAIDATFINATRPGAVAGEIFRAGMAAYAAQGYPDEWTRLQQGGATGYAGRDYHATPDSPHVVRSHQAFAWNPSIAGTKSEDTLLVTPSGPEVLTLTPDLPHLQVGGISRPGILVR